MIVAQALTEATGDDATMGITLIEAVDGDLASVTADPAYDTITFYDVAGSRGATVVVPPTKTARVTQRGPRLSARDRTIKQVQQLGRRLFAAKLRWLARFCCVRGDHRPRAELRSLSCTGVCLRWHLGLLRWTVPLWHLRLREWRQTGLLRTWAVVPGAGYQRADLLRQLRRNRVS